MAVWWTGVGLALAASLAINTAFLLQHAGGIDAPAVSIRRPVAGVLGLFASKLWLAGITLGCAGWALHVAALSLAPLSAVQAFYAGGLALAAPIATLGFGHTLSPAERRAVAIMAGALAVLSVGLASSDRRGAFADGALAAFVAGSLVIAVATYRVCGAPRRPVALGLAAGLLYGLTDTLMKALTHVAADRGLLHALLSPWAAAAVISGLLGFLWFQRGLQSAWPVTVIAVLTASSIVLSVAGGLAVFGDPVGRTLPLAALHALAFVAVCLAAWSLAKGQARFVARGPQ